MESNLSTRRRVHSDEHVTRANVDGTASLYSGFRVDGIPKFGGLDGTLYKTQFSSVVVPSTLKPL